MDNINQTNSTVQQEETVILTFDEKDFICIKDDGKRKTVLHSGCIIPFSDIDELKHRNKEFRKIRFYDKKQEGQAVWNIFVNTFPYTKGISEYFHFVVSASDIPILDDRVINVVAAHEQTRKIAINFDETVMKCYSMETLFNESDTVNPVSYVYTEMKSGDKVYECSFIFLIPILKKTEEVAYWYSSVFGGSIEGRLDICSETALIDGTSYDGWLYQIPHRASKYAGHVDEFPISLKTRTKRK